MRICLISPPTVTDFEDPAVAESEAIRLIAEHAPMGVLSLAGVLDSSGAEPTVVDLNRLYYEYLRSDADGDGGAFSGFVAGYFEDQDFDLFGFSTICSSYPLTIRMAERIKRDHPDARVVLGGPQASVVDVQTLAAFSSIDFIVRGEAEETFPALVHALESDAQYDSIPGITYRRGSEVVRNPNAPVIHDLDQLPLPAFHLYPYLKECRYVPLELGRGCPFACSFCSTNDFFRRRFRLKSPEKVLSEMRWVRDAFGVSTFDLIHDMFTVDRRRVLKFCETLLESGETFYWNCSARTDCIDDELIAVMAEAGCRGIFFGIETGSQRMQKLINKRLDLDEAMHRIASTDRHGIKTAVSLIVGFPEETAEDVRDTVAFTMESARFQHADPQFHLLAPLAETPIHSQYREQLFLDDIYSDMSYQGWRQDPADRALIRAHPDIFPNFYALPTPVDRVYLKELREFLLNGLARFRWLLVGLHQESGNLVSIFERWQQWRREREPATVGEDADRFVYYEGLQFRDDFVDFAESLLGEDADAEPRPESLKAVRTLVEFERKLVVGEHGESGPSSPPANDRKPGYLEPGEVISLQAVPSLAPGARAAQLGAGYLDVVRALQDRRDTRSVAHDPVTIVARSSNTSVQLIQLSPLSSELLALCDGVANVSEIVERFSHAHADIDGIPPDKTCIFGLEVLRQQGVLVASA